MSCEAVVAGVPAVMHTLTLTLNLHPHPTPDPTVANAPDQAAGVSDKAAKYYYDATMAASPCFIVVALCLVLGEWENFAAGCCAIWLVFAAYRRV